MEFFLEHLGLIISVCASIIATIFGYLAGRWHQLFLEKRSAISIAFHKLYAPFVKEYLRMGPGAFYFTDLSSEHQKTFFNLLIDNYEYTDSALKTLIYEFRCAFYANDFDDANKAFFNIAISIDDSYNKLSKKLFLKPNKF